MRPEVQVSLGAQLSSHESHDVVVGRDLWVRPDILLNLFESPAWILLPLTFFFILWAWLTWRKFTTSVDHAESNETVGARSCNISSWLLWARISLAYFACMATAGTLSCWSVVQPLYARAGIYSDRCADGVVGCDEQEELLSFICNVAFALTVAAAWFSGVAFDVLGPRTCSVIGSVLCCIGQLCLSVAVDKPLLYSWLICPGAFLADLGGVMNSFAIFGFMWHDPEQQGLIVGLANGSNISGILITYYVVKHVEFSKANWIMCVFAFISAILCQLLIPGREEYDAFASRYIAEGSAGDERGCTEKLSSFFKCFNAYYKDNCFFLMSVATAYTYAIYYTGVFSPFLTFLLKSARASAHICAAGNLAMGVGSLFVPPIAGVLKDQIGFGALLRIMLAFSIIQAVIVRVPNYDVQLLCNLLSAATSTLVATYAGLWCSIYAPPSEFGNFSGAIQSMCGIFCLLVCLVMHGVMIMTNASGFAAISIPLTILALMNVAGQSTLYYYMLDRSMPEAPPVVETPPVVKPQPAG